MMKMWKKVCQVGILTSTSLFVGATTVFAQGGSGPSTISLIDPLNCTQGTTGGQCFLAVMNNIIGFIFWDIAVPLSSIMVLVGAFQMITAAGDPEKFSQGRKTLLYAAVGFVVALMAGGISDLVKSIVGGR